MFSVYLKLGFDHILDFQGYDHILFIVALCAPFIYKDWKKILILVTAFTIGHSLTLALSALNIFTLDAGLIEVLIPVTILITGLYNIIRKPAQTTRYFVQYGFALFFGLIHGMGFSNFFKALLSDATSIAIPLLAFNTGVELGQILLVIVIMLINFISISVLHLKKIFWTYGLSIIAIILSIMMILERI